MEFTPRLNVLLHYLEMLSVLVASCIQGPWIRLAISHLMMNRWSCWLQMLQVCMCVYV